MRTQRPDTGSGATTVCKHLPLEGILAKNLEAPFPVSGLDDGVQLPAVSMTHGLGHGRSSGGSRSSPGHHLIADIKKGGQYAVATRYPIVTPIGRPGVPPVAHSS